MTFPKIFQSLSKLRLLCKDFYFQTRNIFSNIRKSPPVARSHLPETNYLPQHKILS